ncbi:probable pectinesterase/pectinesterase inhibitor 13 [Typha latifolia]|uniref:probable pectinesterase/pectinesterase inhibitor 13 n=1 Tax=Typha latifolia TaxID=4733 RepID=UPI003C2CDAA4
MSSFQDDVGQRRKKIIVAGCSASLLLLLIVGTVASIYIDSDDGTSLSTRSMHSTSKSVKMICSSTDYRSTCESSLSKVISKNSTNPKEVLTAAISVVVDEASRAFGQSRLLKSNDSKVRTAMEDCMLLFDDVKYDLNRSLGSVVGDGVEHIRDRSHDMEAWMSAVMTFEGACVDGFPEGEVKKKMEAAMSKAKEMSSNAIAIIGQVRSFLSVLDMPGLSRRRRLLTAEDGIPSWVSNGERRILTGKSKLKLNPNVTVAKDGSGDFDNISAALAAMPEKYEGRYVIYVKAGIYEETVNVTRKMANLTMYGDGSRKSIITGSKNFVDGTRTWQTATFAVSGDRFMAIRLGFRNTAGAAKHQAVALRVKSDMSVFLNCRMEGYQDTLYAQVYRQFYRGCIISGTVDFIFGDASAVFQNCVLVVRRPLANQQNIVTAHGRIQRRQKTGFVIQRCRILPDAALSQPDASTSIRSYLGRPWKEYARTIIMESHIGGFIHPDGYMPWDGNFALSTLYYAEFNNVGGGAHVSGRVTWPGFHIIDRDEAERYTPERFLYGAAWIPATGAPVKLGMYTR